MNQQTKSAIIASILSSLLLAVSIEVIHFYNKIDILYLIFVQSLIAFGLNLIIYKKKMLWPVLLKQTYYLHLIRALTGISTYFFYYKALILISPINASLVQNSAPIFIPFIALIFLLQKISLPTIVGACLGFLGVCCVLFPHANVFVLSQGYLFALLSALFFAASIILVKELAKKEDYKLVMLTYHFHTIIIVYLFSGFSFISFFKNEYWLIYVILGCLFFTQQFFISFATAKLEPTLAASLNYFSIIFVAIIDKFMFRENLTLDDGVGLLLIIIGQFTIFFMPKSLPISISYQLLLKSVPQLAVKLVKSLTKPFKINFRR